MREGLGMRSHILVLVAVTTVLACSRDREAPIIQPTAPPPPPPGSAIDPATKLALEIITAPTWTDAFARARPHISDVRNQESAGEILFAGWASKNMAWSDVSVVTNETSVAKVLKDSVAERGRRACAPGTLIQIAVDRSMTPPVFVGLLITGTGGILRFLAVGDTGDLVAQSEARFCGIVAGQFDYDNSGGGTGHAVAMVGMFDLPANRRRGAAAVQAAPAAPAARRAAPVSQEAQFDACCTGISHAREALGSTPDGVRLDDAVIACATRNIDGLTEALQGVRRPAACSSF